MMPANYLNSTLANNLAGAQAVTNFLDAAEQRPLRNQATELALRNEIAKQQAVPAAIQAQQQSAQQQLDKATRTASLKTLANAAIDLDSVTDPAEKAARYTQIRALEMPNWKGMQPWPDQYGPEVQAKLDYAKTAIYGDKILASQQRIAEQQAKPDKQSQIGQLIAERDALPEKDSRRQLYDRAIEREVAARGGAGGSDADYGQFLLQPDGSYLFGSRRTGMARPVMVEGGGPARGITGDPDAQRRLAAARESGQIEGKAETEAQINLPTVIANADQTSAVIDRALAHPGLPKSTGLRGAIPSVPGSDARNFEVLLDQLKGKTFLEAFTSLKGAGAITDIEGRKAEDAIARLDRAQSEPEFRQALSDLKDVVQAGKVRSQVKANGQQREVQPATSAANTVIGRSQQFGDITESDVQETMRANNLTRVQVLQRLGLQ